NHIGAFAHRRKVVRSEALRRVNQEHHVMLPGQARDFLQRKHLPSDIARTRNSHNSYLAFPKKPRKLVEVDRLPWTIGKLTRLDSPMMRQSLKWLQQGLVFELGCQH